MRTRSFASAVIPPLLVFLLLGLIWHLIVTVNDVQSFIMPTPVQVGEKLWEDRHSLSDAALVTASEMLVGFLIGAGIGFALATLMAQARLAQRALYPVVVTTQTIPPIALAVPLTIWLGYTIWPKVIVTALIVFFPVLVNTYQGLTSVDRDLLALMRSMGASRLQTYLRVQVPFSAPLVFAALKLAATYSVIGAVFGEWVNPTEGIGNYIIQSNSRLQTDKVYAAVVVLSAIGIVAFLSVLAIEYACTPWRRRSTARRRFRRPHTAQGGSTP